MSSNNLRRSGRPAGVLPVTGLALQLPGSLIDAKYTSPRSGTILSLPDSKSTAAVNARVGIEAAARSAYFRAGNLTN